MSASSSHHHRDRPCRTHGRAVRWPRQSQAACHRRHREGRPVDAHDGRRQLSGLSRRHHGPGSDGRNAAAGRTIWRHVRCTATSTTLDLSQRPFRIAVGKTEYLDRRTDPCDRCFREVARPWRRQAALWTRCLDLCHLRWFLFQGKGSCHRRRRRHRHGRSDLLVEAGLVGHRDSPPRHAARVEGDAGQGLLASPTFSSSGTPKSSISRIRSKAR